MTAIARRFAALRPRPRQGAGLLTLLLVLLSGSVLRLQGQAGAGGGYFVPGNPKAGMQAFFDKGCARCHSVLGEGGRSAPDLARAPAGYLSSADLLAAMWNHAPTMWEKMQFEGVAPPRFSEDEMKNLFAFLYSVRSLDEPGDPERGRQLLQEKRCLQCHAVSGQGGHVGPDLMNWASYRNPVSWIQTMWNHAPRMQAMLAARGWSWPQFKDNDVADLIAYLRTLASNPRGRVYLRPADPEAGRRVFQQKGCLRCHGMRGAGASRAPDLGQRTFPRTLGQFAGLMWNHSPGMRASMEAQSVRNPTFSNKEMADLIAYLFAQRYFDASGDAGHGRRVFADKGCDNCHTVGSDGGTAPDLAHSQAGSAPSSVATALWNHGPIMLRTMRQQQIDWPRFQQGEVVDLLEFLSRSQSEAAAKSTRGPK